MLLAAGLCCYMAACSNADQNKPKAAPPVALIDGIAKSDLEIQHLSLLAEGGSADAASQLGIHYALVEHNEEMAKHWYHKAAMLGGQHEQEVYQSYLEVLKNYELSVDEMNRERGKAVNGD